MELSEFQQISYLVENLTTSGNKEIDKVNLKKLKKFCKTSHEHVKHTFHLLFKHLEADHAEVRLNCLFVIDELFQRSHIFRELLLDNFHEFLELTAETNFEMPLPEPRAAAKEVIRKTLILVKNWSEKFGKAYKKLDLGYNFLKSKKKIQLVQADEVQTLIQRNAQEDRARRKNKLDQMRMEKVQDDIDKNINEIKSSVAEIEACFTLLVPDFNSENKSNINSAETHKELRDSGLISHNYKLELDLSEDILTRIKIQENQDNETILENLRDRKRILQNIHLPKVKHWLGILGACGAPSDVLKSVIDVKILITKSLEKCKDLVIDHPDNQCGPSTSRASTNAHESSDEDSSGDDDDFIEVMEKPIFDFSKQKKNLKKVDRNNNKVIKTKPSKDTNIWKPIRLDDNVSDPASYLRALKVQESMLQKSSSPQGPDVSKTLRKIHPKKSTPLAKNKNDTKNLQDIAPVVAFGTDLLEWDESKKKELKDSLIMSVAKELDVGHRFYGGDTAAKGDDGVSDAALAALTTRSIEFVGDFQPVKWTCRAPLPSGRLCPRQDRLKCPFHGTIIPRGPDGIPSDPADVSKDQFKQNSEQDWQDPNLLREIKAITGVDLEMPKKKKRKVKSKKYGNLTNINEVKNTSRFRLEKRVLDPKSLKRVSETLDTLDTKRNMQKFGNNFNYALN